MNNLLEYPGFSEAIGILLNYKPKKKQLLKLAEETNELSAAIMKKINKGDPDENILEEMIDVEVNLHLIYQHFTDKERKDMVARKIEKMLGSKDLKKYRNKSNAPCQI